MQKRRRRNKDFMNVGPSFTNRSRAIVVATIGAMTCACSWFDPDRQARTNADAVVPLVPDSPEVRRLIADGARIQPDRRSRNGSPEQKTFIDTMLAQPKIGVPPGSFVRIIEQSKAQCTRHPHVGPYYIKVIVTTGSEKGKIAWGCLGDGIYLAHVMP
jgi:hypothetical protein